MGIVFFKPPIHLSPNFDCQTNNGDLKEFLLYIVVYFHAKWDNLLEVIGEIFLQDFLNMPCTSNEDSLKSDFKHNAENFLLGVFHLAFNDPMIKVQIGILQNLLN